MSTTRTLVLFTLLLSGCGGNDMSDLQAYVEQTQVRFQGDVEPLPQMVHNEAHTYRPDRVRDPFRPMTVKLKSLSPVRPKNNLTPNLKRTREELENYALDSLSMVGVLHNDGERWAIIRTPDNTIFRVRKGNYLGKNNGRILSILETRIDLKEIVADGLGGWIERKNNLALTK